MSAVDPATSRRVRALAEGLHWARTAATTPEPSREWLRLATAIALLDLPAGLLERARDADAFDMVAGRVHVLHGPEALAELQWWAAIEVARESVGDATERRAALAFNLHGLARDLGWVRRVAEGLARYGGEDRPNEALDSIVRQATIQLGLDEELRHGPVPGLSRSYSAIYRLARMLGELRALHLLEVDGVDARLAAELGPAMEQLELERCLHPAIRGLDAPGVPLWDALDAYFEVGVGGLSDVVYRAAHDQHVLGLVPFRGLTFRRAIGGLQAAARELRADSLSRELNALALDVAAGDTTERPPSGLVARVSTWLDEALPQDGTSELEQGRILAWAWRFRGYAVPVDAPRIERFLAQFPGQVRWVGEGLLDAVEFLGRDQLAAQLAFVLRSYGLASASDVALIALDRDDFREDLRQCGLRIPGRTLSEAAADPRLKTLILCDDAVITGGRLQDRLGSELSALDSTERESLARREWVICAALGTLVGIDHVGNWLEAQLGHPPRILIGREFRLLSDLGLEELDAGTLYSEETGALTQPTAQLARPLFSVHEPAWRDRDPQVAREVCASIGQALIAGLPEAVDWSTERVAGSGLGIGGLQGRLVLGHRTPESTLTLLWCSGTWRGRTWMPLFPGEEG